MQRMLNGGGGGNLDFFGVYNCGKYFMLACWRCSLFFMFIDSQKLGGKRSSNVDANLPASLPGCLLIVLR